VEQIAIRLDEPRRLEFRRVLIVSGVLHTLMFGLLAWSPSLSSMTPPAAVIVDLTLALPSAASKPGPAARPAPKPKPTRKAPVVLPTQPSVPKPQAKPRTKPEPAPPEEEADEVEYEDLMAKLRADAGEPDPAAEPAEDPVETASIVGGGGGRGVAVPPELAAWMRASRIHVRRSWVVPPDFEFQTLVVEIAIELDASGNVLGTEVKRRSGSPYYDDNVVSSIQKASPLPAPPEAGTWSFVFYSDRDA
jgi:protein TonB